MRIKIQKTDDAIKFQSGWAADEMNPEKLSDDFSEMKADFFDMAEKFFQSFPRFKEIVFNTELSDDGQEDN